MVNHFSLFLVYLFFLVGSLLTFSKVYRGRAAKRVHERWFPRHHARDLYVSLLSLEPSPPAQVLVSALLRRAMTDITRLGAVRDSKQALSVLLQRGQIGDDTWNQLLDAEKEMEAEIVEVIGEANSFRQGWGQQIFAFANDMVQHEKVKEVFLSIEKEREAENARIKSPANPLPSLLAIPPSEGPRPPSPAPALVRTPSGTQQLPTPSPTPPNSSSPAPGVSPATSLLAKAVNQSQSNPVKSGTEEKS